MFCGSFGRAHNKPNWIMGIELAFNFLALCPVFCSFCAKFWTLGFMSDLYYIFVVKYEIISLCTAIAQDIGDFKKHEDRPPMLT